MNDILKYIVKYIYSVFSCFLKTDFDSISFLKNIGNKYFQRAKDIIHAL